MSDNDYEAGPSKPKLKRLNNTDVSAYIELKLQEHNNSSLVVVNISPQPTDYDSSDDDVINTTVAPSLVSSSHITLNPAKDEHGDKINTENKMLNFDFASAQDLLVYPPPKNPIDYFMSIVDNDFLTNLTDKTNKNAASSQDMSKKGSKWKKVTLSEMKKFIGLLLHTGTIQMSRLADYWKKHYLFNLSCFSNFMSRNRFCFILRYLSFGESDDFENQSLNKIGFVLDYFNNNMSRIYYPGRELILDESVVLWRRQMTLCQNKKGKRHREGLRLYALKEPDGTVQKFHLTSGKNEATENMVRIALKLLEGKLDKGHATFMNECFSLSDLAEILLKRYTYSTGLMNKNEENIPALVETAELKKNENKSNIIDGVHYGIFRDGRNVKTKYISTQYGESFTDFTQKNGEKVSKPTALVEFKKYFRDSDQQEDIMAYYPCNRKNLFWHKKMFIHVLQMSMVNSYLLYNKYSGQNIPLYNFRVAVLETLLPEKQVATVPFLHIHRLSKIENIKIRQKKDNDTYRTITEIVRKECRNCRNNKKVRCSTIFECKSCEDSPGYCVECFFACH